MAHGVSNGHMMLMSCNSCANLAGLKNKFYCMFYFACDRCFIADGSWCLGTLFWCRSRLV